MVLLFALVRHSNSTLITTLSRSLITANITVIMTIIITASTALIPPTDEVGIDKAIAEAPTTVEEALMEDLVEVDSGIEPDINKGSNWNSIVT